MEDEEDDSESKRSRDIIPEAFTPHEGEEDAEDEEESIRGIMSEPLPLTAIGEEGQVA